MLHVASRSVLGRQETSSAEVTLISVNDAVSFFKRHVLAIATSIAAALAIAVVYIHTVPPGYVAVAMLLIESHTRATWHEFGADVVVDSAEVESQVEVIRSASVALEVINALDLTNDPEFVGFSEFVGLSKDNPSRSGLTSVLANLTELLGARPPGGLNMIEKNDPVRSALTSFTGHLAVRRVGQSNVIEVAFASVSPDKAALIVNETLNQYLKGRWREDRRPDTFRRFNNDLNRESLEIANAQLITAATPPLGKSTPKSSLILAFAGLFGAMIGMALSLAVDKPDRRLRALDQIRPDKDTYAHPPLPRIKRLGRSKPPLVFEVIDCPFSKFSDCLRAAKLSLDASADTAAGTCVGVISVEPGAGVTSVAANLAALYALAGSRALLIDANFRNQALSRSLAPYSAKGLVECLRDGYDGCIVYNERLGSWVLPVVNCDKVSNSADLLRCPAMAEFLKTARAEFDTVIVDLPPTSRVVDGKAISVLLDQMIYVARYGKTNVDELTHAINHIGGRSNNLVVNMHSGSTRRSAGGMSVLSSQLLLGPAL